MRSVTHLAPGKVDGDQVALGGLDLSLQEALLLVGYPACLLAIVRFALVDTLLLERHEQVRGWIGIVTLLLLWLRHLRRANETVGLVETRELSPEAFLQTRAGQSERSDCERGTDTQRLFVSV